jgi:D-3-phosphoglycerate dehydrogenase / 2-oxoglutarate reductase
LINVLLCGPISAKAVETLRRNGINANLQPLLEENKLIEIIPDYNALIVRSATKVTKSVIKAAKKLKLIVKAGSGYNNIDLDIATKQGIVIENCPDSVTNAVVEFTVAQLLLLSKKIIHSNNSMKKGKWEKDLNKGTELNGKILGIIGFGRIGSKVAVISKALGMSILTYDPYVDRNIVEEAFVKKVDFNYLISQSDYITLHLPLNNETENLITMSEIDKMKDSVCIINNSRGGIINETDLYKAIDCGKIYKAAIDVWSYEPPKPDHSLINYDQVICTPHIAGSTFESQENVGLDAANQVVDAFTKNKLINVVNKTYEFRIDND